MKKSLTLLLPMLATTLFAERQPYTRYETIVDRQMFGQPPPGFDPTKMPNEVAKSSSRDEKVLTQEQEAVRKSIRFTGINGFADGAVVSLEDYSDPKSPHYYLLKVGESQNGWTVKGYDAATEMLTVERDEVEVTVKLGGESGGGSSAKSEPRAGAGAGLATNRLSFRERRRLEHQQQQADAAKLAEEAKAREAREEQEKKDREAERAEQREQLLRIQEELRKAREARENQQQSQAESESGD